MSNFGMACTAVLCLAGCTKTDGAVSGNASETSAANASALMRDISPAEFVADMGIGINIGNTLDSFYNGPGIAGETGWGNPKITRELITAIAGHGYRTIRLPVTWMEHLGPAPDYRVEDAWMARVTEVVNWCLDEGLYVIVNLHHDGAGDTECWIQKAAEDSDTVIEQFTVLWTQIAAAFVGAPDHLVFEAMNEVGFDSMPYGEAQKLLTRLNQTFVDTVRQSGGNNSRRFLLVSGYFTDIDRTCDSFYRLPQDTQNRLMLSVHYYGPSTFCIAEKPDNSWGFRGDWGTDADYAELTAQFNKLRTKFTGQGVQGMQGIPVILGEYGVVKNEYKDEASRIAWMKAVMRTALEYGMCPVLWDTGGELSRRAPYAMSESLRSIMNEQ
ncbi:cellulase [Spirochaetia bacterium]|nr:cellulase [Spirochaetia bacterium]